MVRHVWNEPSNKGQRVYRLYRALYWQVRKRLLKRPVRTRLWNGALYMADPADEMASFAFYARIYHSALIEFTSHVAAEGPMVDVGANTGLFSLMLSHRFKEAMLYEASPEAARKAESNVRLNRLDHYQVKPVAVCDAAGTIRFSISEPTGLTNRITENEDGIVVPTTTLDDDLTLDFKSRLSFLKIDVEGGELNVLKGARETMATSPHLLVLFERLKNTPIDDLLEFFAAQNYSVFTVSGGLPTRSPEAVRRAHDLFACSDDRFDLIGERAATAQRRR